MATKLLDVVEIVENTNDFILLEITGERKDVIRTGVLDGNEEMVKVTKGKSHTITWYYEDGKTFSHDFGISGYTLVSENASRKKRAIVELIENDLCTSLEDKDTKDLPQSKADVKGRTDTFEIMYWEEDKERCIHKNGHFYKRVAHEDLIINEISNNYVHFETFAEYVAGTGCIVEIIKATGRK